VQDTPQRLRDGGLTSASSRPPTSGAGGFPPRCALRRRLKHNVMRPGISAAGSSGLLVSCALRRGFEFALLPSPDALSPAAFPAPRVGFSDQPAVLDHAPVGMLVTYRPSLHRVFAPFRAPGWAFVLTCVRGAGRQRSACCLVAGSRSAGCLLVVAGGSVLARHSPRESGVNRLSLVRAHNNRMNPTAQQLRCWVPAPLRVAAAGYAARYAPGNRRGGILGANGVARLSPTVPVLRSPVPAHAFAGGVLRVGCDSRRSARGA